MPMRNEEALRRLVNLLETARDDPFPSSDDDRREGHLSRADFDEVEMLADYLGDDLPRRFRNIINEGYAWSLSEQRLMSQRLKRILEIEEIFPSSANSRSTDEFLPKFRLSAGDKTRVLELTEKMRRIVLASAIFDEAHKRRLLNRINAIEKQVHQESGLLDVVLGGVSDVGDTLKKFGTDLKPLTDRMSEIKRITQSNSEEYAQIPPPEDVEALPSPDEES